MFFIEKFIKDMRIKKENYKIYCKGDISQLLEVSFNNEKYFFHIQYVDGGGFDLERNIKNPFNAKKKISIPFSTKAFREAMQKSKMNSFKLFVVNLYFPINNNNVDLNDFFYFIIPPNKIYNSNIIKSTFFEEKNIINLKINDSSRWVYLRDLISLQKTNIEFLMNNSKNVYIVKNKNIFSWFKKTFLSHKSFDIFVNDVKNEIIEYYKKSKIINEKSISFYRKLFRDLLIIERGNRCEMPKCNINLNQCLVSSHIKAVKEILNDDNLSEEKKVMEIIDTNNGFLFCRNHDLLFDRHLISIENNKLICNKNILDKINQFNIENNMDFSSNEDLLNKLKYLKIHNKNFDLKNTK